MKKYKGWEIAKLISEGKLNHESNLIDENGTKYRVRYKHLVIEGRDEELGSSFLSNDKCVYFIVQESVSFMDCVNSDKLVRVEHELTNKIIDGRYYEEFKNGECIPFEHLMFYLSSDFKGEELRTVIEEGKWYLEEAEDGEVQDL